VTLEELLGWGVSLQRGRDAQARGEPAANGGGTLVAARYALAHHLGSGTTGAVYAATDRHTGETVAVKALTRATPRALLRFKRSFRALNRLRSPYLVRLLSLHEHGGEWFLVMEPVDGQPFDAAMTPHRERGDFDAIRRTIAQVALGLDDLHCAGFVHRDLKPANVLVDRAGTPRLLDFELVDLVSQGHNRHEGSELAGTPRYMAPEQIRRQPSQPATDYFALGVMTHFALTGRHAHDGTTSQIFADRCRPDHEAPPPSNANPDVPADLDQLVVQLMRGKPADRAGLSEVLATAATALDGSSLAGPAMPTRNDFVGRKLELDAIEDTLRSATREESVAVLTVVGASGLGKSALLERVVGAARRDGALVLEGRCRQLESMPYRGVDEVVDALSAYLRSLPDVVVGAWLDHRIGALVRLFPVLRLVRVIDDAADRARSPDEPQAARRYAAGALRQLFAGVAEQRPVVCVIDDLQWCDVDGALVLEALLSEPPSRVHWILATRPPGDGGAPAHRVLATTRVADGSRFELTPLSRDERDELTRALLPADRAEAFAQMLGDHERDPFSVVTLARIAAEDPARALEFADVDGLGALIQTRHAGLSAPQRRVVDGLSLAHSSIDTFMIRSLLDDESRGALEQLEQRGWVRAVVRGDASVVELSHDRLREWITPTLKAERRVEIHTALADAFEARADHRPGQSWAVARHRYESGDLEAAGRAAERAGDLAVDSLAFERAREAFALATEAFGEQAPPRLIEKLADVHRDDGRGDVAADLYLQLADRITHDPPDRTSAETEAEPDDFLRKAARALLDQGHDERGREILGRVLDDVDVKVPRTVPGVVARIVAARRRVPESLWQGLTRPSDSPNANCRRADACWAASIGYALGDPTWSMYFHTLHLEAASKSGDADRVARAVCLDLSFRAPEGGKLRERNVALARRCQELWGRHPDRYVRGVLAIGRGLIHFHLGEFERAASLLGLAVATFRARCRDFAKETATAQSYELASLATLGQFDELATRLDVYLPAAEARRNRFVMCLAQIGAPSRLWLAQGRPDEARRRANRVLDEWSHEGRLSQHMLGRISLTEADLYDGEYAAAIARMDEQLRILGRSMLGRAQVARVMVHFARGRAAAMGVHAGHRGLRRRVRRDIRALEAESQPWATALAIMLRASLALGSRDRLDAAALLRRARSACQDCGLRLHAAACAHVLGDLLGGEAGGALLEEAAETVRVPDAATDQAPVALFRVMLPTPP